MQLLQADEARVPRAGQSLGVAGGRAEPAAVGHPAHTNTIHRHSSWEHKLLGDADPKKLSMIGTWQDLISQT
ncbi:MAG: hypothetical protein ABIP13_10675, partial [Tepidiformaceae bacterium]